MRIRSVHPAIFIMLLACCLIGCDSAIFDNLSGCPQGVNFQFYSRTSCEQFPNYPSDIRQVRVFAFDEQDVLVGEFSDKKAVLSADYSLPATLRHTGKLTFVAWGGSDLVAYDFSGFKEGVTAKQEMWGALRLKDRRVSSVPAPLRTSSLGRTLYHYRKHPAQKRQSELGTQIHRDALTCHGLPRPPRHWFPGARHLMHDHVDWHRLLCLDVLHASLSDHSASPNTCSPASRPGYSQQLHWSCTGSVRRESHLHDGQPIAALVLDNRPHRCHFHYLDRLLDDR